MHRYLHQTWVLFFSSSSPFHCFYSWFEDPLSWVWPLYAHTSSLYTHWPRTVTSFHLHFTVVLFQTNITPIFRFYSFCPFFRLLPLSWGYSLALQSLTLLHDLCPYSPLSRWYSVILMQTKVHILARTLESWWLYLNSTHSIISPLLYLGPYIVFALSDGPHILLQHNLVRC